MVCKKVIYGALMIKFPDWQKLIRDNLFLLPALALPVVIFAFTLSRYYGFYYDNHYFNLLALEMMDKFRLCFYLGSTYSIHSTLFSYLVYPFFYIFGPTDFSMEFVSALFHLGVVIVCYKLGKDFFSKAFGLIFAYLVAVAPLYLINVYTWNEYTLIAFLNILSVYYYLCAFREHSGQKMILSSFFYALSCLQAIYSMLLLLFFVTYALINLINFRSDAANFNQESKSSGTPIFLRIVFYIGAALSFLYLILLLRAMFISSYAPLYYAGILLLALLSYFGFRKLPGILQVTLRFHLLFFVIAAVILLSADLFVQLDVNFFGQQFGHYRDTYYAGGLGPFRAPFVFGGKALAIFGRPVYLSVLSSIFAFRTGYAKVAFDIYESARVMVSYYRQCYDPAVILFFLFGIAGLFFDIARRGYKRERLDTRQIFPLAWLIASTAAFVNVYPYHMLRIYILPMPYLLAALGINYIADMAAYIYNRRRFAGTAALVVLTLFLSLRQVDFSVKNIFRKYRSDKARSNYYLLFHGWTYGRGYKEVGDFLLKNAPLKIDGKFRSAFVYTISPYTSHGICSIFYNDIDWYTQNKIKIIYDEIHTSYNKYGSRASLIQYLAYLFTLYPDIETVFFADFYDTKDNFAFFSKMHPDIAYYKIINDDDTLDYDCVLYKFDRDSWQSQLSANYTGQ